MTNSNTIINKTIFKQILNYCWLSLLISFISCNTKNKPENINGSIRSIFQDKNNNFWFGTDQVRVWGSGNSSGGGVYRYDGKNLVQFTIEDGLSNNQVRTIQEDGSGNIWFSTGGGICRFDGQTFISVTDSQLRGSIDKEWKIEENDLWFEAGGGIYRYNGNSFTYLPLPETDLDSIYTKNSSDRFPYATYCTLKDKKGNLWIGTQSLGVCRYDGKSFTWFTGKGLCGCAVRCLFEDKSGNLWFGNNDFGNNGGGLFRYDGKALSNFTVEKVLNNEVFVKSLKSYAKSDNLARVWTINEDNNGDIWIGTMNGGAWRYDGQVFTNYTVKDGLTSNNINIIYKDKKGELWFGTGDGVCKFNGKSFIRFAIE
jgi:ligand-binding sensor domain-containing protein